MEIASSRLCLDPHKDHMKLREIHQRFAGLPTPFIGPRLPQSDGKRRRSRTRHKKKALHWPVSPHPRPAPQPPGPPPIPKGTDDDDWTDDDDEHDEDSNTCNWEQVWEEYFQARGYDYDALCDPDSVYNEPD